MKLWTIQHIDFYKQLQSAGIAYTPIRSEMWNDFPWAYRWMMEQMTNRMGAAPLSEITSPVWAWYQYCSRKKNKPPYKMINPDDEVEVMLELEVPDSEVLLSDFTMWHHCLSGWDLAPEAESRQIMAEVDQYRKRHRLSDYDSFPPELQAKISAKWDRIFDLKTQDPYICPQHTRNRSIQASLWIVRKEWVKSAVQMTAVSKDNVQLKQLL